MRRNPSQLDLMVPLTQDASTARFSPCRRYRYTLTRTWDPARPALVFCMLNPSTADETQNDPTVERCQRRAVRMGFGGVTVLNLFAFRSTDPTALYAADDPVGPENDAAILATIRGAGMLICAWGKHGNLHGRGAQVRAMFRNEGIAAHALAVNQDGTPKHPLYVRNDVVPISF